MAERRDFGFLSKGDTMELPAAAPLAGISFTKLIENADPVVQLVMLLLAVASVACWAIGIEKALRYTGFLAQVRAVERPDAAREVGAPCGWLAARFHAACADEIRTASDGGDTYRTRLEKSLAAEIGAQLRRLQSGLAVLATVGSTAPFVGLFGTVWGIMNSFNGIAAAKDTSLAVVAPGIAEALLATAIGLVAAIPAVVFYNFANVFLTGCAERLGSAAARYAKAYAYRSLKTGGASLAEGRVDGIELNGRMGPR